MTPKEILSYIHTCRNQTLVVLGDVMLDEFHWCKVNRISPEAPVPICKVESTTLIPGGAANVAHNIQSLSNTARLVGVIGKDNSGIKLLQELRLCHVSPDDMVIDNTRPTILKSRIIAHHQQVVRVDREDTRPFSRVVDQKILKQVQKVLPCAHGVILSDYLKGTLSAPLTQKVIQMAKHLHLPVIADPKGDSYEKYQGATVLTPNFHEFQTVVKKLLSSEEEILKEGLILIEKLKLEALLITRSEKGMTLITKQGGKTDIPTIAQEVFDITGAGDTVIALFSIALSAGLEMSAAARLANAAAGIVVGKLGTATTTLEEIQTFLCAI